MKRISNQPRLPIFLGVLLIVGGFICNVWTLTYLFSEDNRIVSLKLRGIIWVVQCSCLIAGILILRFWRRQHMDYFVVHCGMPAMLLATSLFVCSLGLYWLLETFPQLISGPLIKIPHFAYLSRWVPDADLVARRRQGVSQTYYGFRGDLYSPNYGVSTKPMTYRATFAANGFRSHDSAPGANVVVIGDSYVEFGLNENDTFPAHLQNVCGLKVKNLGRAWYGPDQYLAVLKRYGLDHGATTAVVCFFEGNDIGDIQEYQRWKTGGHYHGFRLTRQMPFLKRYTVAVDEITRAIGKPRNNVADPHDVIPPSEKNQPIHPDMVELELGDQRVVAKFGYNNELREPETLLQSEIFTHLREVLEEFKEVCAGPGIELIVLYIPTKAHIYAKYTTEKSGEPWLKIKHKQIAAQGWLEQSVSQLCAKIQVRWVSLTPAFEEAARNGELLFYPFDTHWNTEGRQLAAEVVASQLN